MVSGDVKPCLNQERMGGPNYMLIWARQCHEFVIGAHLLLGATEATQRERRQQVRVIRAGLSLSEDTLLEIHAVVLGL